MATVRYQHRQSTSVFVLLVSAVLVVVGFPVVLADGPSSAAILVAVGLIVLAAVFGFSRLQTTVTADHVRAEFRFGWPARTIRRSAIVGCRAARNRWWYGFGIHLVPGGWLYNVWGLDAVEVDHLSAGGGQRTFRIGTDDPDGLVAAISAPT